MQNKYLHDLPDVRDLYNVVSNEQQNNGLIVNSAFVEKDYWLMHCLWGLQQQGYHFALKGGTSLSKGFGILERFSEDIDIQIFPEKTDNVRIGKNQDKLSDIKSRKQFFDRISDELNIPGLTFNRDLEFDDPSGKMRSAGIRGTYNSHFAKDPDLKPGILLELGFDQITPNIPCDITSWVYEKAKTIVSDLTDNRAISVHCYCPQYSFVEKLQAISTKYRQQQEKGTMPNNFLRHYYDVYKLLADDRVLRFIGTPEYIEHKNRRFRKSDEKNIKKNDAFIMPSPNIKNLYVTEFQKKASIYFGKQPKFEDILDRILTHANKL